MQTVCLLSSLGASESKIRATYQSATYKVDVSESSLDEDDELVTNWILTSCEPAM